MKNYSDILQFLSNANFSRNPKTCLCDNCIARAAAARAFTTEQAPARSASCLTPEEKEFADSLQETLGGKIGFGGLYSKTQKSPNTIFIDLMGKITNEENKFIGFNLSFVHDGIVIKQNSTNGTLIIKNCDGYVEVAKKFANITKLNLAGDSYIGNIKNLELADNVTELNFVNALINNSDCIVLIVDSSAAFIQQPVTDNLEKENRAQAKLSDLEKAIKDADERMEKVVKYRQYYFFILAKYDNSKTAQDHFNECRAKILMEELEKRGLLK